MTVATAIVDTEPISAAELFEATRTWQRDPKKESKPKAKAPTIPYPQEWKL